MRIGQATGPQIVFLLLAVLLLSVPLSRGILQWTGAGADWRPIVERTTQFVVGATLIFGIPALRRTALRELTTPIPKARRLEVVIVGLAKVALAFAMFAAIALWLWASQGTPGLSHFAIDPGKSYASSVTAQGLVRYVVLAAILAPVVEELVCRCFLYRALERQYGWIVAMLGSSLVFGLLHTHFAAAFTSGLVFACLYRRTGSLWAPIAVHAFFNLMLWWPLLGQHVAPWRNPTEPGAWAFHAACLAFAVVAVPTYVYMSRDSAPAPTVFLEPDGALQK